MISPGQALGVLGGGPIGRMLAQAAQALGYRVHVYEPNPRGIAAAIADRRWFAPYEDASAVKDFARQAEVVTCVFENAPLDTLAVVASAVPLLPRREVLEVCHNRQRQKVWLRQNGFPHVLYAEALDGDIVSVIGQVGRPCVVKTADFERDGRGQMKIVSDVDRDRAAAIFRGRRCILERWVDFSCELTVLVARSTAGEVIPFPLAETIHARGVLDLAIAPARVSAAVAQDAIQVATAIAEKLEMVGVLAVEMFVTPGGEVLVNELAPRPHNSGHWTLDGCETSQFEQHVRAVCGLPLGSTAVREPGVMVNILGDVWYSKTDGASEGRLRSPNWPAILGTPRAKLYLYGESEPHVGRRMGHFTVRDSDLEAALARAKELKERL